MSTAFWFATPVYSGDLTEEGRGAVSAEIDQAIRAARPSFGVRGREPGLSTTLREDAPNNFIVEYGMRHLANHILEHAQRFCVDLRIDRYQSASIENSWASIMTRDGFEFAHSHSPSMVSGIYYHQTSRDDGSLIFQSPNVLFSSYDFPNNGAECAATVEYRPKVGRILLFPSWLVHFVDVNRTSTEQISISFTLRLSKTAQ